VLNDVYLFGISLYATLHAVVLTNCSLKTELLLAELPESSLIEVSLTIGIDDA
jgi:hypothetical protein